MDPCQCVSCDPIVCQIVSHPTLSRHGRPHLDQNAVQLGRLDEQGLVRPGRFGVFVPSLVDQFVFDF